MNARDIGECIYCGFVGESLTKEHALPYGLNGPWTLLRASCAKCTSITHRFERDALQNLLLPIRTILAMQTRHPDKRPKNFPLVIESNGESKTIQVLPSEFPLYLPMPFFSPLSVAANTSPSGAIPTEINFIHISGPTFEEVAREHSADFVGARLNFSPQELARTLAKIAFCAAVYVLGIEPFRTSSIRTAILDKNCNIGHWVGSWDGEVVNEPDKLHSMQIRSSGSDVHVILRLFAQFNAPEYHVMLGPADPEFVRSKAWPWK